MFADRAAIITQEHTENLQ